jgi:hypothetical protein
MRHLHVVVNVLVDRGSEVGSSSLGLSDGSGVSVLEMAKKERR